MMVGNQGDGRSPASQGQATGLRPQPPAASSQSGVLNAAHTPGPWIATNAHTGPTFWRVESDAAGYPNDGWVVANEIHGPDGEANARLIAAAPELIAVLVRAREVINACYVTMGIGDAGRAANLAFIDAALAKAGAA